MNGIIKRELGLWKKRPVYVLAPLGAMLFCTLFFLTFFGNGSVQELPIAVVDNDDSSLTRNFIRQLDATELGKVVRYENYASARDVLAGRKPVASFYLNTMYYVGGMMSYKNILTMFNLSVGAVQRETMRAMGMSEDDIMAKIQPILIDVHQIGNPTTDYNAYLSNILLPGLLELLTIIIVAYALGTEIKYGTSEQLMEIGNQADTIFNHVLGARMYPDAGPLRTCWFSACGIRLGNDAEHSAYGACKRGIRNLHSGSASCLPPGSVHQRLPRHPCVLAFRIHGTFGADAWILQRHGCNVSAQAILQFLYSGDDIRLWIRWMVDGSASLSRVLSRHFGMILGGFSDRSSKPYSATAA